LFRFFKLHPQHGDFSDMFQMALIMHKSYLFDILAVNNINLKTEIAEYYFAKKHYRQALDLFAELQNETEPSAPFFQKLGYAYQKTSLISNALDAYLKADIIQPDNLWTVRKIALCHKLQGNIEKALEYYKHAGFLEPEKISTVLQTGKCYEDMGNYKEANSLYIKLDAENENNPKIWRAITWCGFAMGNMAQADYFVQRLLETKPDYQDYINAGHIAWCTKNNKAAVNYYLKSIEMLENKWDTFHDQIMEDRDRLFANGIDKDDFRLMLDELQYRI
jgi:tetratricopeptide (TPR) repeat protein